MRDSTLPKLGVRLEDRPDGSSICKFMSAAEQAEVEAPCAACLSPLWSPCFAVPYVGLFLSRGCSCGWNVQLELQVRVKRHVLPILARITICRGPPSAVKWVLMRL